MALTEGVTAKGVAEFLDLPDADESRLERFAQQGDRRLKVLIGTTNHSSLLAETLAAASADAAIHAGQILGAAAYYASRHMPPASRGVTSSTSVGESSQHFAGPEDVAAIARTLRNDAIRVLRDAGLYQEVTLAVLTRVDPDEDDA